MSWMYRHCRLLVIASITFSVILLVAAVVFNVQKQARQQQQQQAIISQYEQQIGQMKMTEQQEQGEAWALVRPLPAGSRIAADDLRSVIVPAATLKANVVTDKNALIGKYAKIELQMDAPIYPFMLYEGKPVAKDARIQELQIIQLPTLLKKEQYIDVRIQFPTGEDFVVLSKKQVLEREGTVIWLELGESDRLLFSSATIDAYLQGARLYALTYVEAGLQAAAVANYPASTVVLDLLEHNPNMLEKASTELARRLRKTLESNLDNMGEADKLRVISGNITVQQQLMNERAATLQSNLAQQPTLPQPEPAEPVVQEPIAEEPAVEQMPATLPVSEGRDEPSTREQQAPKAPVSSEQEQTTDSESLSGNSDKLQEIFNQ
ncbi:SAF domain-containing protein [Paenibacillus alvei]|uniref:SAF domain-containing protein n=1 Tax=Paenibacillus alvei TaxID=44250 RepID=UPI0013DD19A4|nr:SAF domain-containing protein [Paenibacillus alvei]